jgi:DNA-binding beta-propeller fold protein YncE
VPPLVTDIDLSLDDKYLYVACWGQGEMHQYDVSDPMNPKLTGKVEIGGIARGTAHPNGKPFAYGPQMVEISRDGKRVYWTNSLYSTWDDQFYPDDEGGQMVMANVGENGGMTLDRISTSSSRKAIAATRSAWRAATVPPTVSATRPSDAWTKYKRQRPFGGPSSPRASITGSIRAWVGRWRCPPR